MRHLFSVSACGLIAGVSLLSAAAATAATSSAMSGATSVSGSIVLSTSGTPDVSGYDDSFEDELDSFGSGTALADFDMILDVPGLSGSAFAELDLTAGPTAGGGYGDVDTAFIFEIVNTTGADIAYEITYSLVGELTASYMPGLAGDAASYGFATAGVTVKNGSGETLLDDFGELEYCVASAFYTDPSCPTSPMSRSGQFSFLDVVFSGVIAPGDELSAVFFNFTIGSVIAAPVPVPASLPLLVGGLGLLGMAGLRRRG